MLHATTRFPGLAALTALAVAASLVPAQGPTWSSPDLVPLGRYDHALAFDQGRGRAVLFGGRDFAGTPVADGTWEWNGAGWIQRTPAHSPSPRYGAAMAYDPVRGITVLFGGRNGAGDQQDTWEWNGDDWTQRLPPVAPQPRFGHAMAYHGGTNPGVLVHGGSAGGSTWQWDGTTWTLRGTGGPFTLTAGMAYVSSQQRTILLGTAFGPIAPTSAWDGNSWSIVNGSGPADAPLAYDPVNDRLIAFGGWLNGVYNLNVVVGQFQSGVLAWSQSSEVWPGGQLSRFFGSAATYDTVRQGTLVFGGAIDPSLLWQSLSNRLGELRSSTNTITQRSPLLSTPPPPRSYFDMAFDTASGTALVYGGWDGAQVVGNASTFDGQTWTNYGNAGITPRAQAALCNVPAWGSTVLFGGWDLASTFYSDTLVWGGGGFFPTIGTGLPPSPRADHDMVCDTARNRIVLYGGYNGVGLSDTWELRSTGFGLQWIQLAPVGSPGPRHAHRLAYDARRQKVVLFGGADNTGNFDGTTWEFTPGQFTTPPVWTQIATPQSPPARWQHTMNYDPARGVVVLFGGYGDPQCPPYCASYLDDVWEYNGITWRQRPIANRPGVREGAASCYDSLRQRIVVHGGNAFGMYGDTWYFDAAVDRYGEGMVGGSNLDLRCVKYPVAGQTVRFSFTNPTGLGWISILAEPAPGPGVPLGPSLLCGPGTVYAFPPLLVDAMGSPGTLEFPLPASMAGLGFTAQGVSLDLPFCFRLSDPLAVTIHSP